MPNKPPTGTKGKAQWRQAREQARAAKEERRQNPYRSTRHPDAPLSPRQISQAAQRKVERDAKRRLRSQRWAEIKALRDQAIKEGIVEHGLDPSEVLQRIIDDAFLAYLLERNTNDQNNTPTNKREAERQLRKEAAYFASLAVQYNIQDRQTKVQETRLALYINLLQRALSHPDIDLTPDQIRRVPQLMQAELQQLRQQNPQQAPPSSALSST